MSLDARLRAAHAAGDGAALARLYAEAAAQEAKAGAGSGGPGGPVAGFYLTQAWIFALEAGLPEAEALGRRLAQDGRA